MVLFYVHCIQLWEWNTSVASDTDTSDTSEIENFSPNDQETVGARVARIKHRITTGEEKEGQANI